MNTPLTPDELAALIRSGENLTVEFKDEHRGSLSDHEIYEAVVCLANGHGGTLLIGVEDDGRITGARPRHGATTDPARLQAAIFNNTVPHMQTQAALYEMEGKTVIALAVSPSSVPCATADGKSLRRSMTSHGTPQCVPYYPHEHPNRAAGGGAADHSAATLDAGWDDLDPLEIERVRQTIRRLHGDGVLLELDDREMVKALRLAETKDGALVPNVAGLLLLGREEALRRVLPTHAIAFQVLDTQEEVKMNDWFHGPLLKSLESIQERFNARNQEQEVQVGGLLRMPIPNYSPSAFREALNNAVLHRDYAAMETVFVQWYPDHLFLTNPGGFVEGITLQNLLVHEPKPRNARLAEAFRRIGLVETTGRGIDKIYKGQLQFGRPLPDYSRSDQRTVRLVLQGGRENLAFAAFVYEQDKAGTPLDLDDMMILNYLQNQRRIDIGTASALTQKGESSARSLMERLVERGLVEPRGEKRGRVYHLSALLYRQMGTPTAYVHAHGFEPIQQEQMVLQYLQQYKRIQRADVIKLCKLSPKQAAQLLKRMKIRGIIVQNGKKRGSYYSIPQGL